MEKIQLKHFNMIFTKRSVLVENKKSRKIIFEMSHENFHQLQQEIEKEKKQ